MELIDYLHESVRWKLKVSLTLDEHNTKVNQLQHLREILSAYPGEQELEVIYRSQGYNVQLTLPKEYRINPQISFLKELDSTFGEKSIDLRLQPPVNKRWSY